MGEKEKNVPHIQIIQDGIATKVYVDGTELDGVRKVSFEHEGGKEPVLKIDLMAADITVDTTKIPALPEIFKPFYVRKEFEE
jgi:hypothetical protein